MKSIKEQIAKAISEQIEQIELTADIFMPIADFISGKQVKNNGKLNGIYF